MHASDPWFNIMNKFLESTYTTTITPRKNKLHTWKNGLTYSYKNNSTHSIAFTHFIKKNYNKTFHYHREKIYEKNIVTIYYIILKNQIYDNFICSNKYAVSATY